MKFHALNLTVIVALFTTPALAHHSFAMFDREKTVQLQGTVKELQLINPHSWLQIVVADSSGKAAAWSLEMGGPGQLTRTGWGPETVKPGDKITVSVHPLRDGSFGGQLISAVLADGRELRNQGGIPGNAPRNGPGNG